MTSSNAASIEQRRIDAVDRYLVLSDFTRCGWTMQRVTLKHPDATEGVVLAERTSLINYHEQIKSILLDLIRDAGDH